ncbi:unnamed protein product [Cyclocybe aegerita]|uniref:Uncharacterized protein n=1 Tax=Cyclocybe aegerita TaxID=1973307 RepID=A0A8S0VUN0_CYCAE|nr:unnamed protein product [Cyclocybe aegerita]
MERVFIFKTVSMTELDRERNMIKKERRANRAYIYIARLVIISNALAQRAFPTTLSFLSPSCLQVLVPLYSGTRVPRPVAMFSLNEPATPPPTIEVWHLLPLAYQRLAPGANSYGTFIAPPSMLAVLAMQCRRTVTLLKPHSPQRNSNLPSPTCCVEIEVLRGKAAMTRLDIVDEIDQAFEQHFGISAKFISDSIHCLNPFDPQEDTNDRIEQAITRYMRYSESFISDVIRRLNLSNPQEDVIDRIKQAVDRYFCAKICDMIDRSLLLDPPDVCKVSRREDNSSGADIEDSCHDYPMNVEMFSNAQNMSICDTVINNAGRDIIINNHNTYCDSEPSSRSVLSQFSNFFSSARSHIFQAAEVLRSMLPSGLSTTPEIHLEEKVAEDALKYPPLLHAKILLSKTSLCIQGFVSQTLTSVRYSFF